MIEDKLTSQNKRLLEIVDKIVSLVKPDKVFLVSQVTTVSSTVTSSQNDLDTFETINHFNLLVICSQNNTTHEMQDVIENSCRAITPVTALILFPAHFLEIITAMKDFPYCILNHAKLLYQSNKNSGDELPQKSNVKDIASSADRAYKCAASFFASAELHLVRNETTLTAFMLHQTIEQFCLARILANLGLNPKTHNLDKLYRLFNFFSFELVRTFPRDNEIEEKLFQAIKDSYTAARYSPDYSIKTKDLRIVADRLRHLLSR
jgi:uncharacterized protein